MYINSLSWPSQDPSNHNMQPRIEYLVPFRSCARRLRPPLPLLTLPLPLTRSRSLRDREPVSEIGPPLELTPCRHSIFTTLRMWVLLAVNLKLVMMMGTGYVLIHTCDIVITFTASRNHTLSLPSSW